MQQTLQQELLRGMVKVEIWRKLWRWTIECALKAQDLRPIPAILSDKKLSVQVRDLEDALKRAGKLVGAHVANATALYERAVAGANFYVEAMPAILYIRESRPAIEDTFTTVTAWSGIASAMPRNASIADATGLIQPHLASIKTMLGLPQPRML
jgi:hypothetical protein